MDGARQRGEAHVASAEVVNRPRCNVRLSVAPPSSLFMRRLLSFLSPLSVCGLILHTSGPSVSRRSVVGGLVAAAATSIRLPAEAAPSAEETDRLDLYSRTCVDPAADCGYTLPSGVRVIDVQEGTGPEPKKGQKIYAHFKVWTNGFRSGPPADSSFSNARVYEWILGQREWLLGAMWIETTSLL